MVARAKPAEDDISRILGGRKEWRWQKLSKKLLFKIIYNKENLVTLGGVDDEKTEPVDDVEDEEEAGEEAEEHEVHARRPHLFILHVLGKLLGTCRWASL